MVLICGRRLSRPRALLLRSPRRHRAIGGAVILAVHGVVAFVARRPDSLVAKKKSLVGHTKKCSSCRGRGPVCSLPCGDPVEITEFG